MINPTNGDLFFILLKKLWKNEIHKQKTEWDLKLKKRIKKLLIWRECENKQIVKSKTWLVVFHKRGRFWRISEQHSNSVRLWQRVIVRLSVCRPPPIQKSKAPHSGPFTDWHSRVQRFLGGTCSCLRLAGPSPHYFSPRGTQSR